MSDSNGYHDLLDETDDPALRAVIRTMQQVYPRVQPPAGLMDRIRMSGAGAITTPPRQNRWLGKPSLTRHHPVRRSIALFAVAALMVSMIGGAAYAMGVLGGSRPHVVQSCSGFGAHWRLSGVGVRMMTPGQFARSGGKLIPAWRHQVARLQHPQYWVTPANADIVDTCRGGSSVQDEIGTNQRAHTYLWAISTVPIWQSNRPTMVGSLRIPTWGGCAPKRTTSPIRAPDGRPVAQLAQVPANLSHSVRVTFTPCSVTKRPVPTPRGQVPASHEVAFRILSQVLYRGSAGTAVVLAARPTPAAARPGLNLGTPAGTLSNGTRIWDLHGSGCPTESRGCSPIIDGWTNDVRWMDRGLIVSVSGDMSVARLKALAVDVVLR